MSGTYFIDISQVCRNETTFETIDPVTQHETESNGSFRNNFERLKAVLIQREQLTIFNTNGGEEVRVIPTVYALAINKSTARRQGQNSIRVIYEIPDCKDVRPY